MPDHIHIRLLPDRAVSAEEFTDDYIADLTIAAFDLSFANPEGVPIGQTTQITQHEGPIPGPVPLGDELKAVATAVIEVEPPAGHLEHETSDIRLEISRGSGQIIHRQVYYNVDVFEQDVPDPTEPPSLYLILPPAGQEFDPTDAHVELPEDGSPPLLADLLAAVAAVLADDPGGSNVDELISTLTLPQSRHVAHELAYNPDRYPLPELPRSLEAMYTVPSGEDEIDEQAEADRQRFEAELQGYYAGRESDAQRLTGFVFALSTALAAEAMSTAAARAGLSLPVRPGDTVQSAKIKTVEIILTGPGGTSVLDPSFTVPAAYFYALGALMPPQVAAEQRYHLATLGDEQQLLNTLAQAIEENVITPPPGVNPHQAVRRLRALGKSIGSGPECEAGEVEDLIQAWLDFEEAEITDFWNTAVGVNADGQHAGDHLQLILCALTGNHLPLIAAITAELGVTNIIQLAAVTTQQWQDLFLAGPGGPHLDLLPPFTTGTPEERVAAFISHVNKFFNVPFDGGGPGEIFGEAPPTLYRSPQDPFQQFVDAYAANAGEAFVFGSDWSEFHLQSAINNVFPDDETVQAWLEQALRTIDALYRLTAIGQPDLHFSLIEALFARGFTGSQGVGLLTLEEFRQSLIGTVAYDFAAAIYNNAEHAAPPGGAGPGDFSPINSDGCLVNCLPPPHLSPLGPIGYLHDLLLISEDSTCEEPFLPPLVDIVDGVIHGGNVGHHLAARCAHLAELLVTQTNLEIPLPRIDLVNECLEALAATAPNQPAGGALNTDGDGDGILAGHLFCPPGDKPAEFCHDALFDVLPEHSSPATPVAAPNAYVNLRNDFSHCLLPYSQPLDINRTYLAAMGTNRFETMRTFRAERTEFVLAPENPPADFEAHRWREPVSEAIAAEYLGINPEVLQTLFKQDIAAADLPAFYGFPTADIDGENWLAIVVRLDEFLERACLSYCQFLELWQAEFVRFQHLVTDNDDDDAGDFPDCEPCDLDNSLIVFVDPPDTEEALRRLIVFIRLWRTLQTVPGARYSFVELRDICDVLGLFNDDGTINGDFVRQASAFQRLRDRLALPLIDDDDPPPELAIGVGRTQILTLTDPTADKFVWALDQVLDKLQPYSQKLYNCPPRPPHFLKLLAENMNDLSMLAGFHPDTAGQEWYATWTHVGRMVEILAKIYASNFSVGQLLYLFTVEAHLHGDDPFPEQPLNETLCRPFEFPDDMPEFSLLTLREKLLAVKVADEGAAAFTWSRIDSMLRGEFGYAVPPGETDHLLSLGKHFFPNVLENEGIAVALTDRQYRIPLASTSTPMWNTNSPPLEGPAFQYDPIAAELFFEVGTTNKAVDEKLARVRALDTDEQDAVFAVYWAPRIDLCALSFLFPNIHQADERLIQEPDAERRWAYFQHVCTLFYERCKIIAAHFAEQVAAVTDRPNQYGSDLAWQVLRHLWADENFAASQWEVDTGEVPAVTWGPQPHGGAFAALLGLAGTGLVGGYSRENGFPAWQEMRGPLEAFGAAENAMNAPVPTLIPAMSLTLTEDQEHYLGVRNGFGFDAATGEVIGGLEGYSVLFRGLLLVEKGGEYEFHFGAPTPPGQPPDPEPVKDYRWFVRLQQGQKVWSAMVKDWLDEEGPAYSSAPLQLRRGMYELEVHFERPRLKLDGPEDVCPQTTGFQLKYGGPDTEGQLLTPPHQRLYLDLKFPPPNEIVGIAGPALQAMSLCYVPTVRDMRRTAIRVHKALLCAHNHDLSPQIVTDSGILEFDFFPLNGDQEGFFGVSYFQLGPGFEKHRTHYDFNPLPNRDNYHPPTQLQDQRAQPSRRRMQALFDLFFEALFDYTLVRAQAALAREAGTVRFLNEVDEAHPDLIAHALRHLGIHLHHADLVFNYYPGLALPSADLLSFHWLVRIWQAEKYIRSLLWYFAAKDIREARPGLLWASNDPSLVEPGETEAGNENLTRFYRDGCLENGEPRRYEDVKRLNNGLRERARQALLAYLTGMERVALPWGGFAEVSQDLSELLLMDVETGLCQQASRIEAAVSRVHTFIQRARLGLEPDFTVTQAFVLLWDSHFATFYKWQTCQRRSIYRENWIEYEEMEQARRGEAFRFLEAELRRAVLTAVKPGGSEFWPSQPLPPQPGLWLLQVREPAAIQRLTPPVEGLGLKGQPERPARPSWLTPAPSERREPDRLDDRPAPPPDDDDSFPPIPIVDDSRPDDVFSPIQPAPNNPFADLGPIEKLPLWIQAAYQLGVDFKRVAAAGIPPASTDFAPRPAEAEGSCCLECGKPHPAVIDEYYFWLINTKHFAEIIQDADWGIVTGEGNEDVENLVSLWHQPEQLPGLLHWAPGPMVHLFWCRVHNSEFQQPRRSYEGVRIATNDDGSVPQPPELVFLGREGDSLHFQVIGGEAPLGYPAPPEDPTGATVGFRFDMAPEEAVVLPQIAPIELNLDWPGGLAAYPYFAYFAPGVPLFPLTLFSPVLAVAAHLRSHCRFEAALKWHECFFDPLREDLSDMWCLPANLQGLPVVPDDLARQRATLLHYLETLMQWGEALMRQNAPEAGQQARLIFGTAAKILGASPLSIEAADPFEPPQLVGSFEPLAAPLNPRLLALYELVEDRLALIHACLNARRLRHGRPNKHMPYWGNDPWRKDWLSLAPNCHGQHTGPQSCLDEADWCCPPSPYRFTFLIQQAQALANEVRGLGAALLAAYEKGDAEYLANLRATHERHLLNLALEIRQHQVRAADWEAQALGKAKIIAQTRKNYYETLIQNGLNGGELAYEILTGSALGFRVAGQVTELVAQAMSATPDMWTGNVGPLPTTLQQWPMGNKLGSGNFATAARISNSMADAASTSASLSLTQAGWQRREEEWYHQVKVLIIEILQIERQILAAERRRDSAQRELNNHQRQIEHAGEVYDFMRDKFTNHALYLWLQQETAALYYQMYELAFHSARQVQRAYNYECGFTQRNFLEGIWDNLHEGLLAGERLQLALRLMEQAYLDKNQRGYELTKHISLRRDFPLAFLRLLITGACEIEIPEWIYDLDYPGHYMRRIKNVSMSLPCVVGPYTGVYCRLTLLCSSTRVQPYLLDPPAGCCPEDEPHNGYELLPDDPRIVKQYAATEAIATSTGQNDAGMFELSFRDERYLPFEYAGTISCWRIELPHENNHFDIDTLSDVLLHLNFITREGGDVLRRAANEVAQKNLPGAGLRYFDTAHDFPEMWQKFQNGYIDQDSPNYLGLRLAHNMFPFLPGNRALAVNRLEIFFSVAEPDGRGQHVLDFLMNYIVGQMGEEPDKCEVEKINCVASAEWPGLYHGVLEIELESLSRDKLHNLGTFKFPADVGEVSKVYLFCGYHVV